MDKVREWGRAWEQLNRDKYAARAAHRRALKQDMSEFDRFVFVHAVELCTLRHAVTGGFWHVDHVTPIAWGGTHAAENLQVVPAHWNLAKRDRHNEYYFQRSSGAPLEVPTPPHAQSKGTQ